MRTGTTRDEEEIRPGMRVVDAEGAPVGRVVHVARDGFLIQGRGFLPREYVASTEGVRGGRVQLAGRAAGLRPWMPAGESEHPVHEPRGGTGSTDAAAGSAEVRLQVHEEELVPEKHLRPVGRVRLVKEVKTEYRTITVPVRREELRVERLPAGAQDDPLDDVDARIDEPFETTVTLLEEVVDVRVIPRVRERVRVVRSVRIEEQHFSGQVRREVVHVDGVPTPGGSGSD